MNFKLVSPFTPTGDQPQAIAGLLDSVSKGMKHQVLLGVTGSGKTFTIANLIAALQRPTLIISHNKTLAAQLYQEFRDFFPHNAVSYFVSYYDYYQPEAYIPSTDTYIEKETEINEEIDKLRLAATTNLLTRKDTIIVASVSCIYNIGSPVEYGNFVLDLRCGMKLSRELVFTRLVELQYSRSDFGFHRGTFRVRGEHIDIFPAYEDSAVRITTEADVITTIEKLDPLSGKSVENLSGEVIYPAKHYMMDPQKNQHVFAQIQDDLEKRVKQLQKLGKMLEAHRIQQKVNFDLEMIQELGYVNGIENYSRYFDGREPGDPPYTLLDYYKHPYSDKWLLIVDESHMTMPQIRGMWHGDRSRKQTLIDFGFRLPSALDNRPLTFDEFMRRMPQTVYVSATPSQWELSMAKQAYSIKTRGTRGTFVARDTSNVGIVEQLIRPTGIVDPTIEVRETKGQVVDLVGEILKRKGLGERVLVTTLTKRMAEDLATFLSEKKYREYTEFANLKNQTLPVVHYLHSDVETLVRSDILDDLRLGTYDVIVGINLLREGLDLPEVSLVAILDADKEGFLRSKTSLIQTMGRAARHVHGAVIMYADEMTHSMSEAISEIKRRRIVQNTYNRKHHITPISIVKPIREKLIEKQEEDLPKLSEFSVKKVRFEKLLEIDSEGLLPDDKHKAVTRLKREMKTAAQELNFELAAAIRDKIRELQITQ